MEQKVFGFQFEPLKLFKGEDKTDDSWETEDEDVNEDMPDLEMELEGRQRVKGEVENWCTCTKYKLMDKEKECVCYRELDVPQLLELEGNLFSYLFNSISLYTHLLLTP